MGEGSAPGGLPYVSLIVVTYNGAHLLGPCLQSLVHLDYPASRLEVLVIDNGSTDESAELVRTHFPQVRWLSNDVNNYCRANNLGVREGRGALVAFINTDVQVDSSWLLHLVDALQRDARLAGVTGKTFLGRGPRISSTGHEAVPNHYWRDRGIWKRDRALYDEAAEVPGISGCASLYRRSCLEAIGGLDEAFVMFYEDVDLGIRCRQRGWRFRYVPGAIAYHQFHGTASDELGQFFVERNRLLLLAKHDPTLLPAAWGASHALAHPEGRGWMASFQGDVYRMLHREHQPAEVERFWPKIIAAHRWATECSWWQRLIAQARARAGAVMRRWRRVDPERSSGDAIRAAHRSRTHGLTWRLEQSGPVPHLIFDALGDAWTGGIGGEPAVVSQTAPVLSGHGAS